MNARQSSAIIPIFTEAFPNSQLRNENSPRRGKTIPPKFHFVPTWGAFRPYVGIILFLRRDLEIPTWELLGERALGRGLQVSKWK